MEKMSMSKPAKQMRAANQTEVQRTESVDLPTPSTLEGKSTPTTTPQSAMEKKRPPHPKGHRVRDLEEDVWKVMDGQSFLHLTDTTNLADVWVQPIAVEPSNTMYSTIHFEQIVAGPHIKRRTTATKMALDDLLRLLHLNDCLQRDLQRIDRMTYDAWLAEKTAAFIKQHGILDSTNRSKLCQYIITEDSEFSFSPSFIRDSAFFFRKISYHSYKAKGDVVEKYINPSMVKCCATRGSFEYMIEGRLFPLPPEWWARDTVPESQPAQ